MKVVNIHEREFPATAERVGRLIDTLASKDDALWPKHSWPPMEFDRPLGIGAAGGHGPIGYAVEQYTPGQSITFRFAKPKGFDGIHRFEVIAPSGDTAKLRHTIEMTTHGRTTLSWLLVIRPLHDALLEDALATAKASLGLPPRMQQWSTRVRVLRWFLSGGKIHAQATPSKRLREGCRDSQSPPNV